MYDTLPISIHAPLRERATAANAYCSTYYFNPRSLTGASPEFLGSHSSMIFQSTLPYGSETCRAFTIIFAGTFQSTLPYGSEEL